MVILFLGIVTRVFFVNLKHGVGAAYLDLIIFNVGLISRRLKNSWKIIGRVQVIHFHIAADWGGRPELILS